jgi:hypothetical protein
MLCWAAADMVEQKSFGHSWQGHIVALPRQLDIPDIRPRRPGAVKRH